MPAPSKEFTVVEQRQLQAKLGIITAHRLAQKQIAELLGVKPGTVSKWLNASYDDFPTRERLIQILDAAGLTADCPEFWGGTLDEFIILCGGRAPAQPLSPADQNMGPLVPELINLNIQENFVRGGLNGHRVHTVVRPFGLRERKDAGSGLPDFARPLIGYLGVDDLEIEITTSPGSLVEVSIPSDAKAYRTFEDGERLSYVSDATDDGHRWRLAAEAGTLLGQLRSDFPIGEHVTFRNPRMTDRSRIRISIFVTGQFTYGAPQRVDGKIVAPRNAAEEKNIKDLADKFIEQALSRFSPDHWPKSDRQQTKETTTYGLAVVEKIYEPRR